MTNEEKIKEILKLVDYAIARNQEATTVMEYQEDLLTQISTLATDDDGGSPTDTGTFTRPLPRPIPDWAKKPVVSNAVHFCSETGNDDTGDGTINSPYQSWKKITEVLRQGKHVRLKRGSYWEITEPFSFYNLYNDSYQYVGDYGEGEKPRIKSTTHVFPLGHTSYWYFHNLHLIGNGYGQTKDHGFTIGGKTKYVVIDSCITEEFRVGVVVGEGGFDANGEPENSHFAMINCLGRWNSTCFFYGAVTDQTFISGNEGHHNGGNGGGHNFYLSGEIKTKTRNYTFQKNYSHHSAPRDGKAGGKSSRGSIVTHGYIENLYFVDNIIIEEKGGSEAGCWGAPIDAGRNSLWGVEEFPNLVYTGNHAEYTGNLLFGLTNADNALVGWNTGIIDASMQGMGFSAPNRTNEDPESKIKTLTIVHNNFHIDGTVLWNSTGIRLTDIGGILDHNIITYNTPQSKLYPFWIQTGEEHLLIKGDTVEGGSYGTNKYYYLDK